MNFLYINIVIKPMLCTIIFSKKGNKKQIVCLMFPIFSTYKIFNIMGKLPKTCSLFYIIWLNKSTNFIKECEAYKIFLLSLINDIFPIILTTLSFSPIAIFNNYFTYSNTINNLSNGVFSASFTTTAILIFSPPQISKLKQNNLIYSWSFFPIFIDINNTSLSFFYYLSIKKLVYLADKIIVLLTFFIIIFFIIFHITRCTYIIK